MIHLRTLGTVDLRNSDGQVVPAVLAQPKRVALLAYLALATPRGPHRRDTLLALFWPEHDTEHARNSLSQSVHVLRRSLGTDVLLSHKDDTLSLPRENVWCDAIAFEDGLDTGSVSAAVELYRGDLLEGFHITDAPEFDRWLETERRRLAGRYAKALETMAIEREGAGDFEGAVTWLRRLAARDPYSSRVALRLIRALTAAGDPGGAAQYARAHEALMREELAIDPDPEILAFMGQLQSAKPEDRSPSSLGSGIEPPEVPWRAEPRVTPANREVPPERNRSHQNWAIMAAGLVALLALGGGAVILRNEAEEPPRPAIRSLAVLPLENLSGDSSQQSFTDGMHDLLITELARYPELSVISRTSVLQYKGTQKRLPQIARELKVDGVIEGALVREGGRVRLTAQLVHGPSDRHLWAQRYDRDLRDVLLLQGELAEAIAREVNAATRRPAGIRSSPTGPADSAPRELYLRELYLRGRHAELNRSLVGVQTAQEAYRQAIELDSNFALGYAGLASAYGFLADYAYAPAGPALDSARMMAQRAVALDSTSSETRTALGMTLGDAGEFRAAERELRRAIELGPSNSAAHYWYAILLVALGRGEEALRESRRAAELDPFAPRGVLGIQRSALYLVTGQRPHLKVLPVSQRRPILKLEPGEPWARARDGVEHAEQGQCAKAQSDIRRAQQFVEPNNIQMLKFVGIVSWSCGERARARAVLRAMKRHSLAREHGFDIAALLVRLGEKDSAFAWLERHRWTLADLSGLSAARLMDPLRSDPRFARLLRRLGVRDP